MKHLLPVLRSFSVVGLVFALISTVPSKAENSWGISGLTGISYGNARLGFTEAASLGACYMAFKKNHSTAFYNLGLTLTSIVCNNIAYNYSFGDQPIIKFFGKIGFWSVSKWALFFNILISLKAKE